MTWKGPGSSRVPFSLQSIKKNNYLCFGKPHLLKSDELFWENTWQKTLDGKHLTENTDCQATPVPVAQAPDACKLTSGACNIDFQPKPVPVAHAPVACKFAAGACNTYFQAKQVPVAQASGACKLTFEAWWCIFQPHCERREEDVNLVWQLDDVSVLWCLGIALTDEIATIQHELQIWWRKQKKQE